MLIYLSLLNECVTLGGRPVESLHGTRANGKIGPLMISLRHLGSPKSHLIGFGVPLRLGIRYTRHLAPAPFPSGPAWWCSCSKIVSRWTTPNYTLRDSKDGNR